MPSCRRLSIALPSLDHPRAASCNGRSTKRRGEKGSGAAGIRRSSSLGSSKRRWVDEHELQPGFAHAETGACPAASGARSHYPRLIILERQAAAGVRRSGVARRVPAQQVRASICCKRGRICGAGYADRAAWVRASGVGSMSMNYSLALHTLEPAHAQLQAALDRITPS